MDKNTTMAEFLPTWVEVDLAAVADNLRAVKEMCGTALMAVVKANAYGHGTLPIAQTVEKAGADAIGITHLDDGIAMRDAGIKIPILLVGGVFKEEIKPALTHQITLPLVDRTILPAISAAAKALGQTLQVHLKIDTGLGRFGIFPEEIPALMAEIREHQNIEIEGVCTHFAMSDVKDDPLNELQMERFEQALESLKILGVQPKWIHAASSATAYYYPQMRYNMVRISESLLGMGTGSEDYPFPENLKRTITWKSRLISVKRYPAGWGISYGQKYHTAEDEWIGIVPVGHGQGYHRADCNKVLIDGKRMKAVGNVCIDQFMVSLPKYYEPGTEVVLLGKQGTEEILPEDLRACWKVPLSNAHMIDRTIPRVYRE